jgi:predicted Zn finger-like uncharacterized protein
MLVECICGESKFAVDAKAIGFNGRLVKCGLCAREWFQESKLNILEKRIIEVDQKLQAKEIEILEQKSDFRKRIASLEKDVNKKKLEQENQDSIQTNINALEQRTREKELEAKQQGDLESRFAALDTALKKMTLDSITKNSTLEKSTFALEDKLKEESYEDRLSNLENRLNINVHDDQDSKKDFEIEDVKKIERNQKVAEEQKIEDVKKIERNQKVAEEQKIEDVQKEVNQKAKSMFSSQAAAFAIDEIKKITPTDIKNADSNKQEISENKLNKINPSLDVQEDNEPTPRIGRKNDTLKKKSFFKKIFNK